MKNRSLDQYFHTISMAYRQFGVRDDLIAQSLARSGAERLNSLAKEQQGHAPYAVKAPYLGGAAREIASRLKLLPFELGEALLTEPYMRDLRVPGANDKEVSILIPIVNQQGLDWYGESPLDNFDFLAEQEAGLLNNTDAVYDFGSHHGVWSAFYTLRSVTRPAVFAFEASIINVEVSALLFLLNDISTVVNSGEAVSSSTDYTSDTGSSGMLVDFVNKVRAVNVRSVCWAKADFVKMDIEGFEYDILTASPWLFDLADNMHLELHIPHLERRGLDYRKVLELLPFEKFDVSRSVGASFETVHKGDELSGYCSLMLRGRDSNPA